MDKRYFLRITFNGTNYSGWQIQPNAITVQEVLQSNLSKLNKNLPVKIMGCGRTDAGVHAINYIFHMDFPRIENISHFKFKLNHMLPKDIAIHAINEMTENSHSRFDATERTYKYYFHFSKRPFLTDRSLQIKDSINIKKMQEATEILKEYQDFEAFSRVQTEVNNFKCNLVNAGFNMEGDQLVFTITANRFLRNMVRAIVGTLIEVGEEQCSLQTFRNIIESKKRMQAGKSAPAKGLFLVNVKYPYEVR